MKGYLMGHILRCREENCALNYYVNSVADRSGRMLSLCSKDSIQINAILKILFQKTVKRYLSTYQNIIDFLIIFN